MSHITDDKKNPWRSKWVQAQFRDAIFYVETDARASGRRVALHQYPKRNEPYAEDMGRTAIQITVNGYVIGRQTLQREQPATRIRDDRQLTLTTPNADLTNPTRARIIAGRDYLTMKNALITALEMDGPGILRLPMQYQFKDLEVMVMGYTVTESRERGGMCVFQMQFVEYGNPRFRSTISTPDEIRKSAATVDNVLMGLVEGKTRDQVIAALQPYTQVFNTTVPPILQTGAGRQQPGTPG